MLLVLRYCIFLDGIGISPTPEQICYRFRHLIIFFGVNQYSYFDIVVFLQKNAGPDFYRLSEFFAAGASLLHLLRWYRYFDDSRTNLLQVLLLKQFFWGQSVLLL